MSGRASARAGALGATTDARSGKGGQLEIPKSFLLEIPVYFGEPSIQIEARLRWGESEGGVKFGVALLRKDGIDIARRTVAKYRESMRIASSVERRREKAGR